MENEMMDLSQQTYSIIDLAPPAMVKRKKGSPNYELSICGRPLELVRGEDFGKIPNTKTPVLYKAGAEKVVWNYGIRTEYVLENAIEDIEKGFFFYRFRCELYKGDLLLTCGYGSSNTRERKNGTASGFDVANTALKIAKKRSLVDGALLISQLSGMFTQDLENEAYQEASQALFNAKDPNARITQNKITYFYTVCSRNGMTKQESKAFLQAHGKKSAKEISEGEFDALCEEIRQGHSVELEAADGDLSN